MCIGEKFCVLFWGNGFLPKSRVFRITTGAFSILAIWDLRIILGCLENRKVLRRKEHMDFQMLFSSYLWGVMQGASPLTPNNGSVVCVACPVQKGNGSYGPFFSLDSTKIFLHNLSASLFTICSWFKKCQFYRNIRSCGNFCRVIIDRILRKCPAK